MIIAGFFVSHWQLALYCEERVNNIIVDPLLQGEQNQKLQLQMDVPLKLCIFDPMLLRPKVV